MNKMERLYDYLCKLNPYTPKDALLLIAIVKIAQVGGMNNLKVSCSIITSLRKTTPANVYGLTFLDSGVGKDKPLREVDSNLLINVLADFKERCLNYKEKTIAYVEDQATKKFSEKRSAEKSKYINDHSPRFLPLEISDATLEGFMASRQAYQDAGFGSTFIKMSEFGDYITSSEGHRITFLESIIDVFDYGDSNPKNIKGEKSFETVKGVGSSAIMHTSPAGLLEGENRKKIFSFFNRGIARRSFVCYPDGVDIGTTDPEEMMIKMDNGISGAEEIAPLIQADFDAFYYGTKTDGLTSIASDEQINVFVYTSEATRILKLYGARNMIEVSKVPKDSDLIGLNSEKAGKDWRAMKLSALIAAFNHPGQKTVEEDDVNEAIRITDLFSKQIEKFYRAKPTDDIEKLYNYFVSHADEWVTKMDIRSLNIVHHNAFTRWFDEVLPLVTEKLNINGYIVEQGKNGNAGVKYRASSITKKHNGNKNVTYSQAETNEKTETSFLPHEIDFSQFHTVTGANKAWSTSIYSQNYRKDDNATGKVDMIALDVDNGMTLESCMKILSDQKIKCMFYTTRNHRKQKDKKEACDRYRIVIPLFETVTLSNEDHQNKIKAVAQEFGIPIDPAARNISRLWFGNPDQEYHYINGDYIDLNTLEYVDEQKFIREYFPETRKGNYANIINSWKKKYQENHGGRNRALIACLRFFQNDEGLTGAETKKMMLEVNSGFDFPLTMKELDETVFKSLNTP